MQQISSNSLKIHKIPTKFKFYVPTNFTTDSFKIKICTSNNNFQFEYGMIYISSVLTVLYNRTKILIICAILKSNKNCC